MKESENSLFYPKQSSFTSNFGDLSVIKRAEDSLDDPISFMDEERKEEEKNNRWSWAELFSFVQSKTKYPQEKKFIVAVAKLYNNRLDLAQRQHTLASKAAEDIAFSLLEESSIFFTFSKSQKKQNFNAFKETCENTLRDKGKILSCQRDTNKLIVHIILALLGIGIIYHTFALAIHVFWNKQTLKSYDFYKTASQEIMSEVSKSCADLQSLYISK